MKYINLFGIFLILIGLCCADYAYGMEIKKYSDIITKEFSIGNNGDVNISNRYGNVAIEIGNASKVVFEITISIEAKNEDSYKDIRNRIDVAFSSSANSVSATTEIESKSKWNWLKTNENESYKIDYKVTLPSKVNLVLQNKYGDIQLPSLEGDIHVNLKYGNGYIQNVKGNVVVECAYSNRLSLGDVSGKSKMDISYSKFSAGLLQDVDIDSKYSDVQLDAAKFIKLDSDYDTYKIGAVQLLENQGKYDKITIGTAQEVNINNAYARIEISQLNSAGDFNTRYGNVKINKIPDGFKSITIKSEYTSYALSPCCNYSIDVDTKYVDVDYPSTLQVKNREKESSSLKLKAHSGTGSSKIEASMRYGKILLK